MRSGNMGTFFNFPVAEKQHRRLPYPKNRYDRIGRPVRAGAQSPWSAKIPVAYQMPLEPSFMS